MKTVNDFFPVLRPSVACTIATTGLSAIRLSTRLTSSMVVKYPAGKECGDIGDMRMLTLYGIHSCSWTSVREYMTRFKRQVEKSSSQQCEHGHQERKHDKKTRLRMSWQIRTLYGLHSWSCTSVGEYMTRFMRRADGSDSARSPWGTAAIRTASKSSATSPSFTNSSRYWKKEKRKVGD
jgi:hypothetical protein